MTSRARVPSWAAGVVPLVIIAALIAGFLVFNPLARLRPVPPVEAVAVERTAFHDDGIELHVRNDGPDPVTIAQVLVNDAYWNFSIDDRTLGRLEATTLRIPYPWEEGLPVRISLVTSTGITVDHDVEAAALTPPSDVSTFAVYALLGVYIGVIPVAVGLLWFPALRRASRRWLVFFLAFTVGLLAFLLVDTVAEGIELASQTGVALDGLSLFAIGALGAVIGLVFFEGWLERRRRAADVAISGLVLAYLVATGIGLHNMGEGVAVAAALAAGEIALGTFLVLGFALHNTTEGLAIVAPLGARDARPSLRHFVALGAIAGAPTIVGAWLGGFSFSPAFASLAFGVAAGAIAQVVYAIGRSMSRGRDLTSGAGAAGLVAGLAVMYVTGLVAV